MVYEAAESGLVAVLYVAAFYAAVGLRSFVLASDGYGGELCGAEEACEGRSGGKGTGGHPQFPFVEVVLADVCHVDVGGVVVFVKPAEGLEFGVALFGVVVGKDLGALFKVFLGA